MIKIFKLSFYYLERGREKEGGRRGKEGYGGRRERGERRGAGPFEMLTREVGEAGEVTKIRVAAFWREAELREGGREVVQVIGKLCAYFKGEELERRRKVVNGLIEILSYMAKLMCCIELLIKKSVSSSPVHIFPSSLTL